MEKLIVYSKYNAKDLQDFCTHTAYDCPMGLLKCPLFEEENDGVPIKKCLTVTEEMWEKVFNNSTENHR